MAWPSRPGIRASAKQTSSLSVSNGRQPRQVLGAHVVVDLLVECGH
jgi:hypothetical protein